ncbi:hypothetical protein BGW80DRAFT_1436089 [Lactifluus volemus]|nr:hypothetical protein BGW80DRAFT_1436089 [Lactifluus volemus]
MHPFGGTPKCPRCSKAVYAAEQVMGPGRKPCLTCTTCGVRLDSFRLLEHDEEPYCKNCHSKNFGTRDLRQANLPHNTGDLSLSPPRSAGASPSTPQRRIASPPLLSPQTSGRNAPLFSPSPLARKDAGIFGDTTSSPGPLLRPTRVLSPTRAAFNPDSERTDGTDNGADQESNDSQFTPSHAGRSDGGLPRTVPLNGTVTSERAAPPTSPPTSSVPAALLGRSASLNVNGATGAPKVVAPLVSNSTGTRYGGSPARQWGSGTPQCPRCGKSVYFAEQVKAVGKTWHKACLRCSECGTSLDSNRLTERDGDPLCHRCYNKLHGPAGSGYALLGKPGG